jgi:hypothetical protein
LAGCNGRERPPKTRLSNDQSTSALPHLLFPKTNSKQYLFCSPETRAKADNNTILYSKNRIDALVTTIITLMILFLLIIPIYVLWHLAGELENGKASAGAATIGVLLVFTLIFSAVLSLFTRARRHEILGAAAAYCAVLVVFISNVGQNGGA